MRDNLAGHKGERVKELVEAKGCEPLFLPSYSPIEEALSKIKALLGPHAGGLVEAIARALDAVSGGDARSSFAHSGYALWGQLP